MKALILLELKKIFKRKVTWAGLAAILLVNTLFLLSTSQNMYAFDGTSREAHGRDAIRLDQELTRPYEGTLTDEKVQLMLEEFRPHTDLHGMNAKYLYQNALQSALYARFADSQGNWNGLTVQEMFGDTPIQVGYVNGWLHVSQDMVRICLMLNLFLILVTAPVFSGEYGGMDSLILSARHGRIKCAAAKITAALITALLGAGSLGALNFTAGLALYGKSGLTATILFAPIDFAEHYIPFPITCLTLLRCQTLLVFTCALGTVSLTLLFSALCGNPLSTMALSLAAFALPAFLPVAENSPLFRLTALAPVYQAQFQSLMSVEQYGNGMLYAVLALPASLILAVPCCLLACRSFVSHQAA